MSGSPFHVTLDQFALNGGLEDDGTAPEWAKLTA